LRALAPRCLSEWDVHTGQAVLITPREVVTRLAGYTSTFLSIVRRF
jgi:hypothetical protein